ncbi:tyrosine-protein phosphatase [Litchfieldia alkalitelluris]|uniref:tyrosine-protein phosphatase n=1 Tax=Litchfieldia alkalitelluris TaxID=304268 RepID=UPI000998DE1E|nr:CpsB/CapC family capsule biosynthesis tyrosine phosphatase [Litchfieldia alkalitelluris]
MIDIHCHILPGVDDGPQSMVAALEMMKHASNEGIRTIIATPHHNSKYSNARNTIFDRVDELNELIKKENIDLKILPGQEPRIYGDMAVGYEQSELLTLNNTHKYLFVELPSNHVPRYTKQLLFDLQLQGLQPIIVHPERNQEIIENPDVLYKLVESGASTQVTASSVTGHFGKKIQKFSLQLIEANQAHFIASDAHNLKGRTFLLREAYEKIEKEYGIDMVYLFQDNAEVLVEGKTIYRDIPVQVKRKKFLGIF